MSLNIIKRNLFFILLFFNFCSNSTTEIINSAAQDILNNDFESALAKYNSVLESDSGNSDALLGLGYCQAYLGNIEIGINNIKNSLALNSNNPEAYYCLGNVFALKEDYHSAIKYYDTAITLNPSISDLELIYYNRGYSHSLLKNDQEAIKDFSKTIGYNSNNYDAYINRSVSYSIIEDYSKAIADCDTVLKYSRKDASAYYIRGVAKGVLGDTTSAILDIKNAIKYGYGQDAIDELNGLTK